MSKTFREPACQGEVPPRGAVDAQAGGASVANVLDVHCRLLCGTCCRTVLVGTLPGHGRGRGHSTHARCGARFPARRSRALRSLRQF